MPVTLIGRSHHSRSMAPATSSTMLEVASVRTPTVPMGQSELTMSMVCLARRPWGVLVSMCAP